MKTTAFIRKQGTIQPIRIDDFPGVAIESFFKEIGWLYYTV